MLSSQATRGHLAKAQDGRCATHGELVHTHLCMAVHAWGRARRKVSVGNRSGEDNRKTGLFVAQTLAGPSTQLFRKFSNAHDRSVPPMGLSPPPKHAHHPFA